MTKHVSKRAAVNGVNLHYIVAGEGPVVLGMHGWPQNHREFLPLIDKLAGPVSIHRARSAGFRRQRQAVFGLRAEDDRPGYAGAPRGRGRR